MMNTMRPELTDSISPDLNWKVSKGYRSAPRRRKAVDKVLKLGTELVNKSTKSSPEPTVSESEKLGVAVLGRRFSENIENVPIKKRRLRVCSPSPPPRSSSQLQENKQPGVKSLSKSIAKKHATKSNTRKSVTPDDSLIHSANEKAGYGEDFSGIEILAAAACNNSIHDDISDELSRDGLKASTSATPLKKTVAASSSMPMINDSQISKVIDASLDTICGSPKDVHEDKIEKSSLEDSLVKISTRDGDDHSLASSKDVRFHWDLNVCMDAWEERSDTVVVDTQENAKVNISIDDQSEKQPVSLDIVANGSTEAMNPKMIPVIADMKQGMKSSPDSEIILGKCSLANTVVGSSIDAVVVTKNSSLDVDMDPCVKHSYTCAHGTAGTSPTPVEDNRTPPACFGALQGKISCSEKIQVEYPVLNGLPIVEGVSCQMGSTVVDDDSKASGATSSIHDDPKSHEDLAAVKGGHLQKEVKAVGNIENVIKPGSGASVGEGHSLLTSIVKDQVIAASQTTVVSLQNPESVGLLAKSSVSAIKNPVAVAGPSNHEECPYGDGTAGSKVATVDPSGVNSHLHDKNLMVATTRSVEQEAGYDSQYEDGELRDSDVPYGEEDENDDIEHVDYGSDTCDTDAVDGSVSGKVECRETEFFGTESRNINMNIQRGFSLGSESVCGKAEHYTAGNVMRQSSVGSKTRTSGSEQLPGDSEASSNRTAEACEGCTIRKHNGDCVDGYDGKNPAKVDGSMSSDTLNRTETSCGKRYDTRQFSVRFEEVGSEYYIGKERSDSRALGKSLRGIRLVNPSKSYWESKRHGSPPYRGSFGSRRPRTRSGIESEEYAMDPDDTFSEAAELVGAPNRVRRQPMCYNSNRSYQPTFRRRSPDAHREMLPMRDIRPDRRRLQRCTQGVGRGIRDYHRPFPAELDDSFFNGPRRLTRREPSTSPPGRRPYYGRPKFQSRGRSRSPLWEQNEVSRHRGSRSPDYRFDGKMERGRVPFQKNSFRPKYEAGFFSPPKRRFSPPHNSRWFDNVAGDQNFRGRRGVGRRFQPSQRFDSVRSRRVDSDDYFEPNVHPRFSELSNDGRECRFEGSDEDRRKSGGRFEIVHRVRRYDSDGVVHQFRYEGEDGFASRNAQNCNAQNFNDCDNKGGNRRPRDDYPPELAEQQQQQQIETRRDK